MSLDNPFDDLLYRLGMSTWLGVDLFFVLSGFLITGILYDAKSSQHYFRNFYARRVLRIFPLYYAFLAGTFLLGPIVAGPEKLAPLIDEQVWYWTYLTNIDIATEGWDKPMHLGHFWSLAVEEQFYLLWPLAVHVLDRKGLMRLCALCFGFAIGLRFILPFWLDPVASYVLMPARLDSLAAGAFVALALRGPHGLASLGVWPRRTVAGAAVFIAVIASWRGEIYELDPVIRTVGFAVIAAGFAALIAVALGVSPGSALRRALSSRPLATLAKYSYALYVVHQPIALLLRNVGLDAGSLPRLWGSQLPGVLAFAGIAAMLTGISAWVSWHLLEEPCLRLRRYLTPAEPAKSGTEPVPEIVRSRPFVISRRDQVPSRTRPNPAPVPVAGLLTYVERPELNSGAMIGRSRKR